MRVRRRDPDGVDARAYIRMVDRQRRRRLVRAAVAEVVGEDHVLGRGRILGRVRERDRRRRPDRTVRDRHDADGQLRLLVFVAADVHRCAQARIAVQIRRRGLGAARIRRAGVHKRASGGGTVVAGAVVGEVTFGNIDERWIGGL